VYQPPAPAAITVHNRYGTDTPSIPAGYKATGEFRPVKKGETYLTIWGKPDHWGSNIMSDCPYIILRRVAACIIFRRIPEKRIAHPGEWFETDMGNIVLWNYNYPSTLLYSIFERIDE